MYRGEILCDFNFLISSPLTTWTEQFVKGDFDEARKFYVVYPVTWELYCVLLVPFVEYIYFLCLSIRSKFSSSTLVNFLVENILMCCQLRLKFKFKHQRGNQSYSRSSLCVADFISRCLWARVKQYSICESRHLCGYNIGFGFESCVLVMC